MIKEPASWMSNQKSALDDDVAGDGNKNSKRKEKHSKHSANRARVKKEEMLTKYTTGAELARRARRGQ
jgi:hypothetical protein